MMYQSKKFETQVSKLSKKEVSEIARKTLEEAGFLKPKKGCGEWYFKEVEPHLSEPAKCVVHGLCENCKPKNHSQQDGVNRYNIETTGEKLSDVGSNPSSAGTNSPAMDTPEGKIASIAYTGLSKNSGTNNFNLSEKIWWRMAVYENKEEEFIRLKDIKEFIKRLKEDLWVNTGEGESVEKAFVNRIDKLAGKDLI